MFSIFDTQTESYLHTGRNSKTLKECIQDGLSYLEAGIDRIDYKKILKYSIKEQREYLGYFDFEVKNHNNLIEED